jgi:hypothetical protein
MIISLSHWYLPVTYKGKGDQTLRGCSLGQENKRSERGYGLLILTTS